MNKFFILALLITSPVLSADKKGQVHARLQQLFANIDHECTTFAGAGAKRKTASPKSSFLLGHNDDMFNLLSDRSPSPEGDKATPATIAVPTPAPISKFGSPSYLIANTLAAGAGAGAGEAAAAKPATLVSLTDLGAPSNGAGKLTREQLAEVSTMLNGTPVPDSPKAKTDLHG